MDSAVAKALFRAASGARATIDENLGTGDERALSFRCGLGQEARHPSFFRLQPEMTMLAHV
jgi:hypothetical protein